MVCEVHGVKNRPDLENAILETNLDNADTVVHITSGATIVLMSDQVISTYGSLRSTCQYHLEELRHTGSQDVYEFAFKFATCQAPQGVIGTVFAQVRFSNEKMTGAYVESLLQLGPKSLAIPLSNCVRRD
jgi:hypothetical protein